VTLHVTAGKLDGVRLIEPSVFRDARGSFAESYRQSDYSALGLPLFVQDNVALSGFRVLRGLHLQYPKLQGKLIQVVQGAILDVAVDLRVESPTFGQWEAHELRAEPFRQLYIPPGFAHGYQVLSERAAVAYKCTAYYDPACDLTLSWRDPALAIPWPVPEPLCSDKDLHGLSLAELRQQLVPHAAVQSF
jgi:dTDP-4-dehydrorhamnose 3,5-epimerase